MKEYKFGRRGWKTSTVFLIGNGVLFFFRLILFLGFALIFIVAKVIELLGK